MNKVGFFFIYIGIAILGFQSFSWLSDGTWTFYSVLSLWQMVLAPPSFDASVLGAALNGMFHWPAAVASIVTGLGVIALVFGSRRIANLHAAWGRRQWIVDQCRKVGYYEWSIPGVLASFDQDNPASARA